MVDDLAVKESTQQLHERAVERVKKCLRENLKRSWTRASMAIEVEYSEFHFARVFKDETGVSPDQFLRQLRLERAKQLLETTTMTVAAITREVGYESVRSFCSLFKKAYGIRPTAYRRATQTKVPEKVPA